jgi:hypothetical protein
MGQYVDLGGAPVDEFTIQPDKTITIGKACHCNPCSLVQHVKKRCIASYLMACLQICRPLGGVLNSG